MSSWFLRNSILFFQNYSFSVLNCIYDSISLILRKNVEKRALYHHLENVFLAIDEIIDDGIIMEIDPNNVYNRLGKESNSLS